MPEITITGPNTTSTTLSVDAGTVSANFLVIVVDADNNPVPNAVVTITATATGKAEGTIDAPPTQANTGGGTTDAKGELTFAYDAPSVQSTTAVTITASATVSGTAVTATFPVSVVPPTLALTLVGPGGCGGPTSTATCNAAPGLATTGFVATLNSTATVSGNVQPVTDTFISIAPSSPPGGTINAPPTQPDTGGANSDSNGEVQFAYEAPNTVTQAVTATLTATASVNGQQVQGTLNVVVQPDVFEFTAPAAETVIEVGSANAKPLSFQWTYAQQAGAEGVSGNVQLSLTGANGSVSNTAQLIINGNVQNPVMTAVVPTNASNNGNFANTVAVSDNAAEFVTITAQDAADSSRTATLSVQFVAQPSSVNLEAQPLVVQASPNSGSTSTLTFTVLNQVNQPISGVNVTFSLPTPASSSVNEYVFPTGGTTNASGQATSQYQAGPTAGTATVEACVQGTSLCSQSAITVQ